LIVTIVAYKRPELLAKLLESISQADLKHVADVIVSCDHHTDEMYTQMRIAWEKSFPSNFASSILHQKKRLGIHNHQRWLYDWAIGWMERSAEIVALEEDCIVSPDTFNLAHWALSQTGYKFLNLAGHSGDDPNVVGEDNILRSSYAWAFTRDFWRELEPYWNGKIRLPYGWDWQVTHLCYREQWRSLTPAMPRAMNTGRENGTYETPATYDRDRAGQGEICRVVPAPESYTLVKREKEAYTEPLPDWVREEMAP
jgi:hypothetical protein